jgi:hypothetical protein
MTLRLLTLPTFVEVLLKPALSLSIVRNKNIINAVTPLRLILSRSITTLLDLMGWVGKKAMQILRQYLNTGFWLPTRLKIQGAMSLICV